MRRTELLQGILKMRFEEAYEGWNAGRLTQADAAMLLGMSERNFRRYLVPVAFRLSLKSEQRAESILQSD